MKKIKFMVMLLMATMAFGFTACSDDEDEKSKADQYAENLFSIENATFIEGNMPEATSAEPLQGVTYNASALTGGMNFIVINGEKEYQKFYIGAEGSDGYWEYVPNASRAGSTIYTIPIMYGTGFNNDITMVIIGVDADGNISVHYIFDVQHVESQSGDLNINLTFSTPKDVDLHLYTPSGKHIYYGDRGGQVEIGDSTYTYGLDHDSNPGCSIDNLNNENIYIPAELVENGEYRVVVNLYENCTSAYDCSWAVITRYKGNIIQNETEGFGNPATGNYAATAGRGDHTTVMTFTIDDVPESRSVNTRNLKITPRELTDAERMKIEFEED